jgi:prephenate dehydratase
VAQAFEELQFFCTKMKVLGTYPQHPFRLSNC